MPTISYAITACNEHRELSRLLELLRSSIHADDEIVVQLDSNATQEVREVAKDYIEFPLDKDFASFKNNLTNNCTKDYIFQIDADEYPNEYLIQHLKDILQNNQSIDVFLVPRVNTVEGLTTEHIKKWGWGLIKLKSQIGEKIIDTNSEEYKLLKQFNYIIEESPIN